jgi:rubrerythrin
MKNGMNCIRNLLRVAKEEGFPEIAAAWLKIADVEQRHETRFLKLKENVEKE